MDENQIAGAAKTVAGKVQDAWGGLTGDNATQAEGKVRQLAGKAQGIYGDAVDQTKTAVSENPLAALGVALGVGFLIGLYVGRR